MPMTWSYSACDLEQLREPAVGDDELEAAFGPGPGAIVVASHDRWLRRRRQAASSAWNRDAVGTSGSRTISSLP
ncbi:hypothetical protein QFZ22_002594 [Streptomyces canus]|uniref:Uncharacterized protein n=1 Tax=Streptomyces canus TaxID=58343 RepID=A0AAW8F9Y9_9ACTN|nr:hypothetical protein [Streptomyces canus]